MPGREMGAGGQGPGAGVVSHFRDLRVTCVYRIPAEFPAGERFGVIIQIRRAAVSIPSNIAEGHSRESTREYFHHLSIAQGSLAEIETQFEIAVRLGNLTADTLAPVLQNASSLGRQLFALRNALRGRL